jgi:hypothetical protein
MLYACTTPSQSCVWFSYPRVIPLDVAIFCREVGVTDLEVPLVVLHEERTMVQNVDDGIAG